MSEGGDRLTGYIPRSHTYFSQELKLSVNAVKSVWRRYCETMQVNPKPKGGSVWSKLKEDDLELIEVLKIHSPSMSLAEIIEELGHHTSISAVSRAVKSMYDFGGFMKKTLRVSTICTCT